MARREIEAGYGLNEIAHSAPVSIGEIVVRRNRNSFSSGDSCDSSTTSQMRVWTPGADTAKLRGREEISSAAVVWKPVPGTDANVGNCDDEPSDDVFKPKALITRMDSGKSNFSDCSGAKTVSSVCSFASTLPSPRDLERSSEEPSCELTTYQPRQQHQPQYAGEDPEIIYTQRSANMANSRADLVRRMQELQKSAESVYQFTSQMNANTRYRHQPPESSYTSTFISELD